MTPLTPEVVASLEAPADPQVSPDGRRVAWTAAPHGRTGEHPDRSLWVAPVDASAPARRWTTGSEDRSPCWSADGSRLAFLSDRSDRGTHGLYVLPADGGEARPVVVRSRSVGSFAWSPTADRIAFLAPDEPTDEDRRREEERDDAEVFGEHRPHRLWLVDPDGAEPQAAWSPPRHLLEVAWSPDGSRVALLSQATPLEEDAATRRLHVLVPGEPDATPVCEAPGAGGIGWAGPGTVVFGAPHEAEPQSGATVWAVAASGGAPRVVGTGVDEPRCAIGLACDPGGASPLLVVAEGLDTRLERVDPFTGGRTVLETVPGEVDGLSLRTTADGPVLAAVVHGTEVTARVLAGPPGGLRPVSSPGEPGDGAAEGVLLGGAEALTCTAADGTPLDAVVIRPPGGGDGPWPTAVLLHGGPYGRAGLSSHAHPLDWGQLLATHGYAVVMPNYRGGYGHGNAFATAVRGDMGGAEWADVLTVVDAAVEAGIADPDRLGIGGWSQGGFLTAWAVTATDRFRAAVMGAGVSDWGMLAATSDLPAFEAVLGGGHRWDGPGPHAADAHSPISYAARRTTPLLILHGAEDARVPVTQATAFRRALAGQDAPLELVTYPREPHVIAERAHQVDLQRRVLEWFDRYLR
jgi:dipeptidyl aminopeptidase/acylaminoacyl peptidase